MTELSGGTTIHDLLPVRDELLQTIAGLKAAPKNRFLAEAQADPYYSQAITAHGLLKSLATAMAIRTGRSLLRPNADFVLPPLEDWLDESIFVALKDGGDHIIEFGSKVNLTEHAKDETIRTALIYGAHRAAERSDHPRFFVGTRGFYTDESNARVGIFSTGNSKEHELAPKYCAELKNLETAADHGFTKTVALVVSGDPHLDDDSNKMPPTLHPCLDCREELATNPIVDKNTIIICANRQGKTQTFTVNQLRRYHHEF
ncbi:MAG TPA: hypothetical protein VM124_01655 [Candidatus Limnocylindrales bacterium]|nr:hypothetical protein [Candidatus Limnocylindrales bacterium]